MSLVDCKYYIFLDRDLYNGRSYILFSLNEMGGFETYNNSGRVASRKTR